MRIDSSFLTFQSTYAAAESYEAQSKLEIRSSASSNAPASGQELPQDSVSYVDYKTALAKWLLEYFTGHKAEIVTVSSVRSGGVRPSPAAPAISYTRQEIHREAERAVFTAEGSVTLDSGASVEFSLHLEMNRELTEAKSIAVRSGNMSDPIAVNLDGLGIRLSGWTSGSRLLPRAAPGSSRRSGQKRSARGVYLTEEGAPGVLQQIDLSL